MWKSKISKVKARFYQIVIIFLMGIAVVFVSIKQATTTSSSTMLSDSKPKISEPISPDLIRSIVHQAKDCWIQGTADTFAALFTSDGELIVPGYRWVGQEAIQQAVNDFTTSVSNVTIEIHRIMIEGNHAVVEWRWEDTQKATGKRTPADDAIVIDFRGNQIERWREYIDTQTPMSSVGK
ncbi:nuclear transport factor 2 family protein [Gloeocapsa sp. PCC 73106]|uniref:nuclear transport factor 2 family protein n=1 Tax=Gloeocapsa sp. PCC 73106 TaxID=102232 RepID=UPI0002ACF3A9|nr:nuclear transport factor 2 family protein [Gloeocapsa sp. PCC 73106]ELR96670.1 hypothetical protein GLO73106DRAFT_00004660 [Gloeocapsa sp. PCC 73106]